MTKGAKEAEEQRSRAQPWGREGEDDNFFSTGYKRVKVGVGACQTMLGGLEGRN